MTTTSSRNNSFYQAEDSTTRQGHKIVDALRSHQRTITPLRSVTKFEVIRQLKKPSFWIALLLMPLFIVGIVLLSAFNGYDTEVSLSQINNADLRIGLTDTAGILKSTHDSKIDIDYATYVDKTAGLSALQSGEIDLYYYIPTDFAESHVAEGYQLASQTTFFNTNDQPLRNILTTTIANEVSAVDFTVLTNNYNVNSTAINADGAPVNLLGQAIIPLVVLIAFYIMICVFSNRLLMTVVEEKENRISEMILTSISAKHLIIGKLLALMVLGFIQIIVLAIPVIALIITYRHQPMVADILSTIEWNPLAILANIILFIISFFFFAGMHTLIGSLVSTAREASQYIAPVMLGVMLPMFFLSSFFVTTPDASVYFLTYFPLSSPITLMLRDAFGTLPWWEFLLGVVELFFLTVLVIYLTVRTFQKNAINFSIAKPSFAIRKRWK